MKALPSAAKAAALGMLVLASACGSNDTDEVAIPTGETKQAVVTLRGVNAHEIRSALIALSEVSVFADDRVLPRSIDARTIDLAQNGEAVAARFVVPEGAQNIRVTLRFDDYGGYEAKNVAGVLDARGTNVSVVLPARTIAESGKADVSIDLARSLKQHKIVDQLVLLPHFQLNY